MTHDVEGGIEQTSLDGLKLGKDVEEARTKVFVLEGLQIFDGFLVADTY